jgi:hypothetical protein
MFVIIYLWRGERHRYGNFDSIKAANADLRLLRDRHFNCWIEEI